MCRGTLSSVNGNLLGLGHGLLDAPDHVEGHLGQMVVLPSKHSLHIQKNSVTKISKKCHQKNGGKKRDI